MDFSRLLYNGKFTYNYYYILPEKFLPYYNRLEASFMNPYITRMQYYMDKAFEAGLPYIWKVYSYSYFYKIKNVKRGKDVTFLKLDDLYQVFSVLMIGSTISLLVFLSEIFSYECFRNFQLACLEQKLKKRVHQLAYSKKKPKDPRYQRGALYYIIRQHKKVKRLRHKILKVRRIYVQSKEI